MQSTDIIIQHHLSNVTYLSSVQIWSSYVYFPHQLHKSLKLQICKCEPGWLSLSQSQLTT